MTQPEFKNIPHEEIQPLTAIKNRPDLFETKPIVAIDQNQFTDGKSADRVISIIDNQLYDQ